MLYLETGCLSLSDVVTVRRLMYLHTILQRPENEIVRKVFLEQRNNPCRGDWVILVEADMLQLHIDFDQIEGCSAELFRKQIVGKIRNRAFEELLKIQDGHEKVRYIFFEDLSGPQEYLCSTKFSNRQKSLLFNLRCRSLKTIKDNFHRQYKENLFCQLSCENTIDSQEHLLVCPTIKEHLSADQVVSQDKIRYEHLFGDPSEQYEAVIVFQTILKVRDRLLDKARMPAYHGNNSGPIS
jgi:hypothetical protein